jgi:transposase
MRIVVETLMQTRVAILDRIKVLDRQVLMTAKMNPTARLFMTAPGVGAITALSVASAFDDAERFKHSSSAGAYLGLTPRRYESGEVSRNGRISKHGNKMTRKHLHEAATTLLTRTTAFSTLKTWGLQLANLFTRDALGRTTRAEQPSRAFTFLYLRFAKPVWQSDWRAQGKCARGT